MSRYYRIEVKTQGTTKEQLKKVMVNEFGWNENYIDKTEFVGEGCLCGGQSEEEAHKEVSKAIKKLNPSAKVKTQWTYLEDLPYTEYGDNLEE
jgi:hypothetical protein